jgi:hypothetical protein
MRSSPQRALTSLDNAIREAVHQSGLAYDFSPNSYTYGSLSACLAAQNAAEVIRAHLVQDENEECHLTYNLSRTLHRVPRKWKKG